MCICCKLKDCEVKHKDFVTAHANVFCRTNDSLRLIIKELLSTEKNNFREEVNNEMSDFPFMTLVKSEQCKTADRWYPKPVDRYKRAILVSGDPDEAKRLKSNFSYSMQYIEYIEKQLVELKLSDVIITMLYKSYIITSMSIIEALFVNLLHRTGHWNTTIWSEISNIVSNSKNIDGVNTRLETHIYKQVNEYNMRMDLDSMIKKIEKKHLLSIDHSAFPALKTLRELRNRVHLQIGDGPYDHDYNCFGFEEIQMMRRILYTILVTPEFCNDIDAFDFIKERFISNGGTL